MLWLHHSEDAAQMYLKDLTASVTAHRTQLEELFSHVDC
jgi:hypothetical protein